MSFQDYDTHSQPLFDNFKILSFIHLKQYNLGKLQFQIEHNLLPDAIQNLFSSKTISKRKITLSQKFDPLSRTTYKKHFISSTGTLLWKNIPTKIKSSKSLKVFMKTFKQHLISSNECYL